MQTRYTREQLSHIREQALVYQCACPAQVSQLISELLALYRYQADCLNRSDVDVRVHQAIANAAREVYPRIEQCLTEVLMLEGWDMETLTMPDSLKKAMLKDLGVDRR
ncbi:MAG TPA: hypothetical protein PLW86_04180 [Rhodocyclaceae bacterium]|nr:hypothetical protein [Rhodocyclaceae bacterium]